MGSSADVVDREQITPGRNVRRAQIVFGLAALLVLVFVAALVTGAIPVSLSDYFASSDRSLQHAVLVDIRTPRVVLAAAVGAALSVSGAALQGLFRNPLADPSLIGVSSGAAVGALSMIMFGSTLVIAARWMPFLVPAAAVGGAASVTLFLYTFARRFSDFSVTTMLLVGIAINAIATVAIGAFEFLSDERQLRTLIFWMMGSYGRATWPTVLPALVVMAVASAILYRGARALDVLQLGEADAHYMGINVDGLKRHIILASAAAVGAGVSVAGIIAFVGLVVPHLVRLLGGASHRYVLAGSALLGASLSVTADVVARTSISPAEMPVGLVTSAMGAPFFLWLIARARPA
ncbi:MAG: iron ABC transporter permease [Pseudomonadota bacterium]